MTKFIIFAVVVLFVSISPCDATKVNDLIDPFTLGDGWISNQENILSEDSVNTINHYIGKIHNMTCNYKKSHCLNMRVVAINWIEGSRNNIDQFATDLFDKWKLGQRGILIVISTGNRKITAKINTKALSVISSSDASKAREKIHFYLKNNLWDRGGVGLVKTYHFLVMWKYEQSKFVFYGTLFLGTLIAMGYVIYQNEKKKNLKTKKRKNELKERLDRLKELEKSGNKEICAICLEDVKVNSLLSCGHQCHKECLDKWLAVKNICPMCRCKDPKRKPQPKTHSPIPEPVFPSFSESATNSMARSNLEILYTDVWDNVVNPPILIRSTTRSYTTTNSNNTWEWGCISSDSSSGGGGWDYGGGGGDTASF